jgi:hypothetical protein
MKKIIFLFLFALFASFSADAQTVTARALVRLEPQCSQFDGAGNFTFCMTVFVYPVSGNNVEITYVKAVAASGDTQATILSSITTAVVNAAAAQNFIVARTAVLIPQHVRGT